MSEKLTLTLHNVSQWCMSQLLVQIIRQDIEGDRHDVEGKCKEERQIQFG